MLLASGGTASTNLRGSWESILHMEAIRACNSLPMAPTYDHPSPFPFPSLPRHPVFRTQRTKRPRADGSASSSTEGDDAEPPPPHSDEAPIVVEHDVYHPGTNAAGTAGNHDGNGRAGAAEGWCIGRALFMEQLWWWTAWLPHVSTHRANSLFTHPCCAAPAPASPPSAGAAPTTHDIEEEDSFDDDEDYRRPAVFSPCDQYALSDGILWDVRSGGVVHKV